MSYQYAIRSEVAATCTAGALLTLRCLDSALGLLLSSGAWGVVPVAVKMTCIYVPDSGTAVPGTSYQVYYSN